MELRDITIYSNGRIGINGRMIPLGITKTGNIYKPEDSFVTDNARLKHLVGERYTGRGGEDRLRSHIIAALSD